MDQMQTEYSETEVGSQRAQRQQLDPTGEQILSALLAVPTIGVAAVDGEGDVLLANARWVRDHSGAVEGDITRPVPLAELVPQHVASERISLVERALHTGRAIRLRHIERGIRLNTIVIPISRSDDGPLSTCLLISHPEARNQRDDGCETVESEIINLGPLESLTPRELDVLCLIGEGLSTDAIARKLSRSPRTVEKHREAIAQKLGEGNRIRLAQIAVRAGLTPTVAPVR